MSVSDLPLVLFLLLPGFLTINVAFLVGRFRRSSTFQATLWSLAVSLLLLTIVYPGYLLIVDPSPVAVEHPNLLQILVNPILVPGSVWVLLYAFALLAGILFGIADRKGGVERVFLWVGVDLSRRGDIWSHQFRNAGNVRVYLNDGTLLVGWPEYYSTDKSQPGPELYLTETKIWDIYAAKWVDVTGVKGILLDASVINRIEFLASPDEGNEEASQ